MIKRLFFNAISQLVKHYKTERVAELFLNRSDLTFWKSGDFIHAGMPDEQNYVLVVDWAKAVLSADALAELFDGYGVYYYDFPATAPRSLPRKNIMVSDQLGRAYAELFLKGIENVKLCRIMHDQSTFPFPRYDTDEAYQLTCLKTSSEKGLMVLPPEIQSTFGWGMEVPHAVVEIRCRATFKERESALAANALMKALKDSKLPTIFMLLKGTFAWAMYFAIEYDVVQKRVALDAFGDEILAIRSLPSLSFIPLSGVTQEGFQVVWSELPSDALTIVRSYELFEEIFLKVGRKLGLEMIGEKGSVMQGAPLRLKKAHYLSEDWMKHLVKSFPAQPSHQSKMVFESPFPHLWTSTWRRAAQKNGQSFSK